MWLKIGTIRHRTEWYIHSDPPIGLKLADDANEIDLDLTLEKYGLTKDFLVKILKGLLRDAGVSSISDLLNESAIDRLVLVCGGVARDFIGIFRKSIDVAKERGKDHRGEKIGTEDVNRAAGEYEPSKREEFKRDTLEDRSRLEEEFEKICKFCTSEANANIILLDKEGRTSEVELIHELVDLRMLHLVRSRVTVSGETGKIFQGYMLDVSQYTGSRKRREFEIVEFWRVDATERLRRRKLIYKIAPVSR